MPDDNSINVYFKTRGERAAFMVGQMYGDGKTPHQIRNFYEVAANIGVVSVQEAAEVMNFVDERVIPYIDGHPAPKMGE